MWFLHGDVKLSFFDPDAFGKLILVVDGLDMGKESLQTTLLISMHG